MKLTQNFTLAEMIASDRAKANNIPNEPNGEQIEALTLLCLKTLEPVRELVGKPIIITSGYRSPVLNKLVRGSKTSQHLKGEAADIKVEGLTTQQLFETIVNSGVRFDQIIQEFNAWVHISFSKSKERRSMIYALRDKNGRVYYEKYLAPSPFETAVSLLRSIHDLQDGPPLEKDAKKWHGTMVDIEVFLGRYEK